MDSFLARGYDWGSVVSKRSCSGQQASISEPSLQWPTCLPVRLGGCAVCGGGRWWVTEVRRDRSPPCLHSHFALLRPPVKGKKKCNHMLLCFKKSLWGPRIEAGGQQYNRGDKCMLNLKETVKPVSQVAKYFAFPPATCESPLVPHSCPYLVLSVFLI